MQTSILCSACKNDRAISDPESGEMVCSSCGLVFSERALESRAEWRNFDFENNDRIRVGSPSSLALHDMGLATVIGRSNSDSSGRRLDSPMHSTIQRLRAWDFRTQTHTSADRNLMRAFNELGRVRDKLALSDAIIEKTAYIYRKAQEKHLIRGRSTSGILAAAIYIACREIGASRSLRDMVEITGIKRKVISRSYRLLVTELDIKMPLVDPMKCIARIANKAKLSEKTKRAAIGLMCDLTKKEISAGKGPMGLAATVLYLSGLENSEYITQKEIAEAAGITEVTIRNRVKDIKTRLGQGE
jgi:transcription initiation factor TFIIB